MRIVESRVLKIKNGTIYLDENGHIMIDEVRKDNVITTDFTELMKTFDGCDGVNININRNTLEEE